MSEKFIKMSKTAKRVYAAIASTLATAALSVMIPMTAAADIADDYIPTQAVSLNLVFVVAIVILVGILFTGGIIALIIVLVTKNKKKKTALNQTNK